jgi:hypothetical protein
MRLGAVALLAGLTVGAASARAVDAVPPEAHCDVAATELRSLPTATAEACRDACAGEPRCAAYVHVSGWGRCFLKAKPGRKATIRFYSGAVESRGGARVAVDAAYDVDYSGKDMRKLPGTASGEACRDACIAEPRCRAFAYLEGYANCWLKETRGDARAKIFSCGQLKTASPQP